jgi:WD40 repeat protein
VAVDRLCLALHQNEWRCLVTGSQPGAQPDQTGARLWNLDLYGRTAPLMHDSAAVKGPVDFDASGSRILQPDREWDARTGAPLAVSGDSSAEIEQVRPRPVYEIFAIEERVVDQRGLDLNLTRMRTTYRWVPEALRLRVHNQSSRFLAAKQKPPLPEALPVFAPLPGPFVVLGISEDWNQVATLSEEGDLRVWDALTGQPKTGSLWHGSLTPEGYAGDTRVKFVAFDSTGTLLASVAKTTARVWALQGGLAVTNLIDERCEITSAAFDGTGNHLALAAELGLRVHHLDYDAHSPASELERRAQLATMLEFDALGAIVPLRLVEPNDQTAPRNAARPPAEPVVRPRNAAEPEVGD